MGLAKPWTEFIESASEGAWGDLISFRPAAWVQHRIAEEPLEAQVQAIEDAWGEINLDYYPIVVRRFPHNYEGWGPRGRHNATSLVELFRRKLPGGSQDDLLDTDVCEFSPFNDEEKKRWFRDRAEGSVLHIDMKMLGLNPDDGSVVCSHAADTEFRVSTIWIGEDGYHPVTGNREWGIWRSGTAAAKGIDRVNWDTGKHYRLTVDEWTFYTRGADRLSTWFQATPGTAGATFGGGEDLWNSMQSRFTKYINANGGLAWEGKSISQRVDWDSIKNLQWGPDTPWVEDTA